MTGPLRDTLNRHYKTLDGRHDCLRAELMAALPTAQPKAERRPARTPGSMVRYAAVLAVMAGLLALIAVMSPGPVLADAVFADVLDRIHRATTVSYTTRLQLGDRAGQTARIQLTEAGLERKTLSDGGVQISDYAAGRILYVAPADQGWALRIDYPVATAEAMTLNPLEQLASLPNDAGRFMGRGEYDNRPACLFEVNDGRRRMMVYADPETSRPMGVEILTAAGPTTPAATLVMSDFVWDEILDESGFTFRAPDAHTEYTLQLIDDSRPAVEADLVGMFAVLTDLAEGVFPESLDEVGLAAQLSALEGAEPDIINLGTGFILMAGLADPDDLSGEPAMVRCLRSRQQRVQVRRGLQFLQGQIDNGRPFQYVGQGVRRGERERVLWYKPKAATRYRVIRGDLTVIEVDPKDPSVR